MRRDELKQNLYKKYIEPTTTPSERFVGVEIEMPIVNLSNDATDQKVAQEAFDEFVKAFHFKPDKYDDDGICINAVDEKTGDIISFDCSYNNLEFSFGKEDDINRLDKRFRDYIQFLNGYLTERNHILTGFGINPNYNINDGTFIPEERYRIIERFFSNGKDWGRHQYIHPYGRFGTFASASQVQLDVAEDEILKVFSVFDELEPYKALLFNNSVLAEEQEFINIRDFLYENSSIGMNPHNFGMYQKKFKDLDEFLDYLMTTNIYNVIRDGKRVLFEPMSIYEFFKKDSIDGEWFSNGEFVPVTFKPEPSDLEYLRTYKFQDLTFRGTIEFRSCCNQPLSDAMSVAAFHLGLMENMDELEKILENETVLSDKGYTPEEYRRLFDKKEIPDFIDQEALKETLEQILDAAASGLDKRGKQEEKFLEPLYERVKTLNPPAKKVAEVIDKDEELTDLVKEYAEIPDRL